MDCLLRQADRELPGSRPAARSTASPSRSSPLLLDGDKASTMPSSPRTYLLSLPCLSSSLPLFARAAEQTLAPADARLRRFRPPRTQPTSPLAPLHRPLPHTPSSPSRGAPCRSNRGRLPEGRSSPPSTMASPSDLPRRRRAFHDAPGEHAMLQRPSVSSLSSYNTPTPCNCRRRRSASPPWPLRRPCASGAATR
jgi:hypothetical protein